MKTRIQIEKTGAELELEVERIIQDTIYSARSVHLPTEAFMFNSDTRLLSHSLELREAFGSISSYVYHEQVKITARGTLMEVQIPPVMSGGRQLEVFSNDLESLVENAKRGDAFLPFDPLDPKLGIRFVGRSSHSVYCSDNGARFTDPKRIVACVNSLLKFLGVEGLDQTITNPMLASIETAYAKQYYHCEFLSDDVNISDVYTNESPRGYSSCMAGKQTAYFEMYDDLERHGTLTMVRLVNGGGEFKGRALCWKGSNPDDLYLDRLYVPELNSVQVPRALDAYRSFCAANGITKAVSPKTADVLGLEFKAISLELPEHIHCYRKVPYADSMYRVCTDGRLRNHSNCPSGVSVRAELRNTDGTLEDDDDDGEDIVYLSNGDRCHIDDATYVDRYSEYFADGACVNTRSGENELWDDCEELEHTHYGRRVYEHRDAVVQTYDSKYILFDDAVELYDGTHAHTDEVRLLDDESDRYALVGDVTELSDGRWVLITEAEELEAQITADAADAADTDA